MRSTFSLLLYINRNKVCADCTTSILCRISIDGKNTVITTGISCKTQQWNAKNAETSDARTNNRLKKIRSNAERLYENLQCGAVEKRNLGTCRNPRSFTPDGRKRARTTCEKSQRNRVKFHI